MDPEQLKLILEMLGTAGEGTQELANWWLILQYVDVILDSGVFVFFLVGCYQLLLKVLTKLD